jgi:hypothetical protein
MEFIMTYGWAMLAVIVMIGALGYFGFYKVDPPEKCLASTGFNCKNYVVYSTPGGLQITFDLENGRGEKVVVTSGYALSALDGLPAECRGPSGAAGNVTLNNGEVKRFSCLMAFGNPGVKKMVKHTFNFTYVKEGGNYNHPLDIEMATRVR